ncbi:interleukin 17C [Mytilus galloprovincialis]|uniref:Interleukin 17C n=2 Tax=Mytilus galloprovincialis TaxID=29158 RepID=A0A8B6EV96_MYTGA|nr:interleukin 17C [Mytilus galloprovincialis]
MHGLNIVHHQYCMHNSNNYRQEHTQHKVLQKIYKMNLINILKIAKVYITYCIVFVNSAPTCTDPKDVQAKFNSINGGVDYRTLFFTDGWKQDTMVSDFEKLVSMREDFTKIGCPSTFLEGFNLPLMARTSCPWFLEQTPYIAETYPHTLYRAATKCTKCIDASGDQKCSPIQQKIKILRRTGCDNGLYKYEVSETYIQIAYVCEKQREVENDVPITPALPPADGPEGM